jgi:hypothetical protein
MQLDVGPHLEEVQLEQYSMNTLPEEQQDTFEEHLLACAACQDRLLEMDAYVNAVRSVSPRLRAEARKPRKLLKSLASGNRAGGLILAVVALVMVVMYPWNRRSTPDGPLAVVLQSGRGAEFPMTKAPAGRALRLVLDLTELPRHDSYRVDVVNSSGRLEWGQSIQPSGPKIEAAVRALDTGTYFARVWSPQQQLLREYLLRIE